MPTTKDVTVKVTVSTSAGYEYTGNVEVHGKLNLHSDLVVTQEDGSQVLVPAESVDHVFVEAPSAT